MRFAQHFPRNPDPLRTTASSSEPDSRRKRLLRERMLRETEAYLQQRLSPLDRRFRARKADPALDRWGARRDPKAYRHAGGGDSAALTSSWRSGVVSQGRPEARRRSWTTSAVARLLGFTR